MWHDSGYDTIYHCAFVCTPASRSLPFALSLSNGVTRQTLRPWLSPFDKLRANGKMEMPAANREKCLDSLAAGG
jgi:hypothetical protein